IKLSGMSDVRFSLWGPGNEFLGCNDSFMTSEEFVSSIDLNNQDLRRGQTIVFGPTKMDASGFADTDKPEMGILTPISDESGTIIATILVTRIGIFQEFSRMFFDIANAGNLDAYAINESGIMLTESPRAATLSSIKRLDVTVEQIAAGLRVSDPGFTLNESNRRDLKRSECPLTESAMSVTNGYSQGRITPYRNYAGIEVVGSWRWNSDSRIGVIVERPSKQAFATVRIVQGGFLLLGSLLFISASVAAAFLARATTAERAAMHPLSRYDVLEEVGSGGMGVVFLARHRQLGRKTALKVMIGGTQKKEDRMRFDREARLAASLSNPHSVMIYDYGRSEDGESYCVMEFLRGLTLQEVVERSGSQPFGRVLFILRQVCEAVSEAHQKRLLHLDIKPQNIMLSLDQTVGDWAVLFDYGLSKPITPALDYYQTPDFQWSGTPMYMAPERIHRRQQLDQRSDIYALGCVAYFLTTGHPPFFESNPDSLLTVILNQPPIDLSDRRGERVPDQFAEIIIKCLSKTPTNRFQSVGEFAEQIEQLQSQHSWSAEDSRQWWKKHGTEHTDQTDFATS
ncbi:serine/threonine protein kinase, partial [bacterium]|nr:serine/threonine protein kinase [bacterium]